MVAGEAATPDLLEALRPRSLKELHESIAATSRSSRLPPIVAQLQELCERRAACQERCVARLHHRAGLEATLLPSDDGPRAEIVAAVQRRFSALEGHCTVLCGRRFAHLVSGGLS